MGGKVRNQEKILINDQIHVPEVRLIDSDGTQLGIIKGQDALSKARQQKLDLVMVAENADPPVCKIVDWGKFQYQAKKKAKADKAKQTVIETKEIQLRPVTDAHDLEIKLRRAQKFLDAGKKVNFHMKFRGREASHSEIGMQVMVNIPERLIGCEVEKPPILRGLNIYMVISPVK